MTEKNEQPSIQEKDGWKSHKVKTTRKTHPNDWKYANRPNSEVAMAYLDFISGLNDEQAAALKEGALIVEEEKAQKFFDEVQEGDVVGLSIVYKNHILYDGNISYQLKVVSKDEDNSCFEVKPYWGKKHGAAGTPTTMEFEDISVAVAMGYAEILYRPDEEGTMKPYGYENDEVEYTLKWKSEEEEKKEKEVEVTKHG